jgi:hypothetical protein
MTWASFLAKPAIDALRHVDIIAGSFTAAILSLVSFNCDRLCRHDHRC